MFPGVTYDPVQSFYGCSEALFFMAARDVKVACRDAAQQYALCIEATPCVQVAKGTVSNCMQNKESAGDCEVSSDSVSERRHISDCNSTSLFLCLPQTHYYFLSLEVPHGVLSLPPFTIRQQGPHSWTQV